MSLQPVTLYGRQWLTNGEQIFYLKPQSAFYHPDIKELHAYSSQLIYLGDRQTAGIVPTQKGDYVSKIDQQHYVLLALPAIERPERPDGISLALFHNRGRSILNQMPSSYYLFHGWRDFWSKRVDDLSIHWNEIEQKRERSEYDEVFLRVFPYFVGRAENAIQYLTDLIMDEPVPEQPVICHHRFNEFSWGSETLFAKTPDQWVIDHPSRDLTEWIRFAVYNNQRPVSEVYDFIDDYQGKNELSTGGLGLVFARLLFPIVFIENGEAVFDGAADTEMALHRLNRLLERVDEEERLLASFGKRYIKSLPRVDWLAHKLKS